MFNEIDIKIKPLTDAMNASRIIRTTYSCQGHMRHMDSPYVAFYAPQHIGISLSKQILETEDLHYSWDLSVGFGGLMVFGYRLGLADEHTYIWCRKKINSDINTLIQIINQITNLCPR